MQGILYLLTLSSSLLFAAAPPSAVTPKSSPKVLFAVMAGYNSCRVATRSGPRAASHPMSNAHAQMVRNLQKKNSGLEVLTLYSCLNEDAPPDAEAEYVLTSAPHRELYGDTYGIRSVLDKIIKDNPTTAVYLVGHSYGGWMSMFLAETLAGKPNFKALFTLDPIGPDCSAGGVIFGGSECHSAPTDRNNKAIQKRVVNWVNFFQKDDSWLTSSRISEATNHEIQFEWGPHSEINRTHEVWQKIEAAVMKSL